MDLDRGGQDCIDAGKFGMEACLGAIQFLQLGSNAHGRAVARQDELQTAGDAALDVGQLTPDLGLVLLA